MSLILKTKNKMTKVNLKEVLKDLNGNPVIYTKQVIIEDKSTKSGYKENEKGELVIAYVNNPSEVLTVGRVIAEALILDIPEKKSSFSDKAKRTAMAMKCVDADEIEFTADEKAIVEECVNVKCETFNNGTIVAGQIYNLLNA